MPFPFTFATVGALYPAARRGLVADILAAEALGGHAYPVCSALVMATADVVTDFTEVPSDAVAAQLEHLRQTVSPTALKISVLANHHTVETVFHHAAERAGPTLLDLQLSGPAGETVLSARGIEAVMDRLEVADLLVLGRTDAELLSGGEIQSLDDAQVAAQRLIRRGARAVVIKAGPLPARHFEVGNGDQAPFNADLYFDGDDFALFEAPHFVGADTTGASSVFGVALLKGLIQERSHVEALQFAKQHVTDWLRARSNPVAP